MLVTAAVRMDDSAVHGHRPSPYPSTSPPLHPWFAPDHHHHGSTPTLSPTITAAAPSQIHNPRGRVARRRPRPSRKLPTTYISADPASFRRMVHQVTGADHPHHLAPPADQDHHALCRPAAGTLLVLPTLDTSAFLLAGGGGSAGRATAASAGLDPVVEAGGAAEACCSSNGSSARGGFPTLESWDALLF